MKKAIPIFVLLLIVTTLAGCNSKTTETENVQPEQWKVGGDIREITSSIDVLPTMLEEKDDSIKEIYLAAAKHPELLSYVPCYCGCSISANHQDSSACFFAEIKEDGSVVWDNHGAKCMTCLEIAKSSVAMYEQGKSYYEIRTIIDEYYTDKGYENPTLTKMPEKK